MAKVIKGLLQVIPGDDLSPEKTLREEDGFLVIEYSPEDKVYLSPDQCKRLGMEEVLQKPGVWPVLGCLVDWGIVVLSVHVGLNILATRVGFTPLSTIESLDVTAAVVLLGGALRGWSLKDTIFGAREGV